MKNKMKFFTKKRESNMGQFLKYILFIVIFTISIIGSQGVFADDTRNAECILSLKNNWAAGSVSFTRINDNIKEKTTVLSIKTSECKNVPLEIKLQGMKNGETEGGYVSLVSNNISLVPLKITPEKDLVNIEIETNEDSCYIINNPDCVIYTEIKAGDCGEDCIFSTKGPLRNYYNNIYIPGTTIPDFVFEHGGIMTNCDGFGCSILSNDWKLKKVTGASSTISNERKCIESLNKYTNTSFTPVDNIASRRTILKLNTKECKDVPLEISFYSGEQDTWLDDVLFGTAVVFTPFTGGSSIVLYKLMTYNRTLVSVESKNKQLNKIKLTPEENTVTLNIITDEDSCKFDNTPDCLIYTEIKAGAFTTTMGTFLEMYHSLFLRVIEEYPETKIKPETLNKGLLLTDCDGVCDIAGNDWQLMEVRGAYENDDFENAEYIGTTQYFDPDNPCYSATEVVDPNTGNKGEGYLPGCYEFLAPIQGIEKDKDGNFDSSTFQTNPSGDRIAIIDITTYQLGDYINKVFQIALAILGVISVIMIIIAGVQYMTVESIYGKSDAKQRITSAVSGLLLSLSIFLILNTINPELLEVNFGSKFEDVKIDLSDGDPDIPAGQTGVVGNGTYIYTAYNLPSDLKTSTNIVCSGTGGISKVSEIVESFKGKVTYRYGGGGDHLPTGKLFRDDSPPDTGDHNKCEDGERCGNFCPEGTFCIDCSHFTSHVLQCAGLISTYHGTTGYLFADSSIYEDIIFDNKTDLKTGKINGEQLQKGDLVGKKGHIAIYIGNGKIAESRPGRMKGTALLTSNMADRYKVWKFNKIIKLKNVPKYISS